MQVNIIGSGFSSLAASAYLAKAGFEVDVYEKNETLGGRARIYQRDGFQFDMGPSWYWMPDVFDRFFSDFDKATSDFYALKRLSPAYKVYFQNESLDIPDSFEAILDLFEKVEPGSSKHLKKFMSRAEYNYNIAVKNLVYKPGLSPFELVTPQTIMNVSKFFTTIRDEVRRSFKNKNLIALLEFPVLFLGAKPQNTPAFYSFMNYADFVLGTWYPEGGMHSVVEGMVRLAKSLGVRFHTNANVENINISNKSVTGIRVNGSDIAADIVLSGADYNHTEQLVNTENRSYSKKFWDRKTFAPSALLYYVGFDKKLKNLAHHTLFFDRDFDDHAVLIYDKPAWPKDPLFYASFPSINDPTVAPEGKEAATFLVPLAPDLEDSEELRERCFDLFMERFEDLTHQKLADQILFKRSYCVNDFKSDYNSFKGNAYGMANTLMQTGFLRPRIKSKKLQNLYFTGQLTVPGPGVPPALISGKLAADLIIKEKTKKRVNVVHV